VSSEDDVLESEYLRERAVEYIQRWIGTPYIYGGDDFSGFDCSGLIVETLQSVGFIKHKSDYTADGLYNLLKNGRQISVPYHGCLVFWFNTQGQASHVAMCLNNRQIIESGGGGSDTDTVEDAIQRNAYVRIRRLNYRGPNYKILDPFKDWVIS